MPDTSAPASKLAGDPVRCAQNDSFILGGDPFIWGWHGVVEAGRAPGWAGAGLFGPPAALGGPGRQEVDARAGEFRHLRAEGFAEGGEDVREFGGDGLGGAAGARAQIERELQARFIGGGKEFELVQRMLRAMQPRAGLPVRQREKGFSSAPQNGRGDGALRDGEKGRSNGLRV